MSETTKFLCIYCRQYVLKTDFDQHRVVHRNDLNITFPRTFEELKQRFEMLGLYDEI